MTLYKSLRSDNKSPITNFDYTPYLSKNGRPGKWLPKVDGLELCASGYHGCKDGDILEYPNANIYEIETKGAIQEGDDKFTAQQIRLIRKCEGWNEVTARLFACDCATRVLHILEKKHPEDKRPRECIATARKFAKGKATRKELAAARDAAWDAAGEAAFYAAGDAAWCAAWAAAGAAAGDAAWAAARDAARDAAGAAAWAAAWDAEKKWQARRLLKLLK